jgi:hypothetical protein
MEISQGGVSPWGLIQGKRLFSGLDPMATSGERFPQIETSQENKKEAVEGLASGPNTEVSIAGEPPSEEEDATTATVVEAATGAVPGASLSRDLRELSSGFQDLQESDGAKFPRHLKDLPGTL